MVPSPWHRHIQQLGYMLRNKSMLLKLENIIVFNIVFISYFKAQCIIDVLFLCVCGLRQRAALRVSYSQRTALRVWCSQLFAESMILSAPVVTAVVVAATNVKSADAATVASAAAIVAVFSDAASSWLFFSAIR
jgi:hypothetical protein